MSKLSPAPRGGYTSRKWLPVDVREAFGQQEAWFNSGPVSLLQAKALHREWLNDVEAKIANIRAERKGEGRTLTPKEARGLAGEWYIWYTSQQHGDLAALREYRERAWQSLYAGTDGGVLSFDDVDKVYLRPFIADEAKTAQFLAAKRLQLDRGSRDLFLDYVLRDFFAALDLLVRRAEGDFGEDRYAKRFPRHSGIANTSLTPWALFERWIAEAKPAASTIDRWRGVFVKLQSDFPGAAAALLPEQMHDWAKGLITAQRAAVTVRDVWVVACRTVFAWAVGQKLIARNPFAGWRITVPRKIRMRETKAFTDDEAKTILTAALAMAAKSKSGAAKRWVPWLCAYTGARSGEITQLRGSDVSEQGGIWAIKISPEAGTVKTGTARTVPLHAHVIEQGFLDFVKASGGGALFYNEAKPKRKDDPTNPRRPRAVKARERVAEWVREIGVNDPELQPNHAWRHTFKKIGSRADIPEKILDAICGHAPATVGRGYGEADLADKAEALRRFPRFKV